MYIDVLLLARNTLINALYIYIYDVVTDRNVPYIMMSDRDELYFYTTISPVHLITIITQVSNIIMHHRDGDHREQ